MKYTHKLPDDSVNAPQKNILLETLKSLLVLVLVAISFYFILSVTLNKVVEHITPSQEKKLLGFMDFTSELGVEKESVYLQELTDKLQGCASLPYKVETFIVNTEERNAFALPGGKIYITKGMLKEMQNENELVYIIGHELGHFKHKHHLKGLGNSLILAFMSLFLDDKYGVLFESSLKLSQVKYSQKAEFEADIFGLRAMECAYGNVNASTSLFERMNDGKKWSHFLDSHPDFTARIKNMKEEIAKKGYTLSTKVIALKEKF